MSYPPQAPPQFYGAPPAYQPPKKGAGLAIASMVLGIIALLLSWVPIVNNVAAVIALVGLGLGIPALLRARRGTHGGTGMAITGLITSVLAVVVVFATQAFYAEVIDGVQEELDRAGDEISAPPAGDTAPVEAEGEPAAEAVPLGVPAQVGDYQVTVDAVELDGNATAAAGNQFNEPATNGQYVVVQLTATYTGAEEGFPGMDLTAVVHGSDNRQYSDSECMAVLPDDAMNAPTLNPGGTDTFQFCMDVPPAALAGAELSVEPTISFDSDERVFYALG
ncbi:hypothetical protein SAMN04515665_105215 [Blastococcus sp. DSM 46786]|uniref:DUF4190 domain-containing protein n=1 Tax=Blastococcus sp. DSM 46786 TaxID=1798227 RepID=UPI0008B3AA33|nr:DUF4190 domain-containing protein [Blastococcus sp. DSM 46786]SEK84603.1 hypothetical protein SAMN04515665_105215 [Blastococcus sp. DSM 46786]